MNWYEGSIAEAVNLSKQRNAIFVVYVEGNDELSLKLRGFINENKIKQKLESEHFVAIKIDSGSQSYMQFAQIYQLVPLPSIFFIGKNGAPIQVVTGVITSADELESKINTVLDTVGLKPASAKQLDATASTSASVVARSSATASQDLIINEQSASDVVCKDGVCYRKPKEPEDVKSGKDVVSEKSPTESSTSESISIPKVEEKIESDPIGATSISDKIEKPTKTTLTDKPKENIHKLEEKESSNANVVVTTIDNPKEPDNKITVEKARKIMEQTKKEQAEEELRQERAREIQRRKDGQLLQNMQQLQKEQELQQLKENIRRDRLEEQEARQRILEKIASDRAEQAQKKLTTPPEPSNSPTLTPVIKTNTTNFDYSRIQFRKPGGQIDTHTFNSSDTFQVVREYVQSTLLADTGIRNFTIATTFPRREFIASDDTQTLLDLGLFPTAVLLIIAASSANSPSAIVARSGGVVNIFNTIFWGILSPFFFVFSYIRRFLSGDNNDIRNQQTISGQQKRANEDKPTDNEEARRRNIEIFLRNSKLLVDDVSTKSSGAPPTDKTKKDGTYRRVGGSNIHRLHEKQDSDDENNTWNGNSTQQQ